MEEGREENELLGFGYLLGMVCHRNLLMQVCNIPSPPSTINFHFIDVLMIFFTTPRQEEKSRADRARDLEHDPIQGGAPTSETPVYFRYFARRSSPFPMFSSEVA